MEQQRFIGRVVLWKPLERYGFIQSSLHSQDIFFHLNDTTNKDWTPYLGEPVRFSTGYDEKGRLHARQVESQSSAPCFVGPAINQLETALAALVFVFFIGLLVIAALEVALPIWVIGWYLFTSVVTMMLYAEDKQRAQRGIFRIREATLHRWEWLGGWPGALLAQQLFRHKRSKGSFMDISVLTAIVHLFAIVGYVAWHIFLNG